MVGLKANKDNFCVRWPHYLAQAAEHPGSRDKKAPLALVSIWGEAGAFLLLWHFERRQYDLLTCNCWQKAKLFC